MYAIIQCLPYKNTFYILEVQKSNFLDEKTLNNTNYQRNSTQNYNVVSTHTGENGYH